METIRLTEKNTAEAVARAAEVLRAGGVVLYPTDTLYGLGADAFSDAAVAKVYAIKGRDKKKPIHCIVTDLEMAERFAEVNELARSLARKFLPGPLTLILRKHEKYDTGIAKGIDTLGIRIPKNEFCLALAKRFGAPYTTTSANVAGAASARSVKDILAQLGERSATIDLIVDAGDPPAGRAEPKPSTVVDVSSGKTVVLREGVISERELLG